jgi:hypothetical protein
MINNINSNYGKLIAEKINLGLGAGKVFVVGKSGLAYRDTYGEIFKNDQDGQTRFVATVDQAIGLCTANAGDTIVVLPGHTETVTATSIALDVAGVKVIGLGSGLNRPTFTFGAAAATITVTGANCEWKGCNFVANFENVASAFTLGAAKDFVLEDNTFSEGSATLNFLSIVTTGTTDLACSGLKVVGNRWYSLATATLAFVSILGDADRVILDDNYVNKASTSDVGHFLTITADTLSNAEIVRNTLIIVGATNATVGIFLTGSSTDNTGVVAYNLVASLDTTSELIATAGTKLKFFENYYTGTADASGKLWPAVDAA